MKDITSYIVCIYASSTKEPAFFEKLPKAIGKRYKTTKIIAKSDSSFNYLKQY